MWSAEQGKYFPVHVCSRLRIWSRETGSAAPSRVSLYISILRLNLVLTYAAASIYIFKTTKCHIIGSVPSLSGHAIAYRYMYRVPVRLSTTTANLLRPLRVVLSDRLDWERKGSIGSKTSAQIAPSFVLT